VKILVGATLGVALVSLLTLGCASGNTGGFPSSGTDNGGDAAAENQIGEEGGFTGPIESEASASPVVPGGNPAPGPGPGPEDSSAPNVTTTAGLPFAVDSVYVASGFMGDGATAGAITMAPSPTNSDTTCGGDRAQSGALGVCHVATYAPVTGGPGWGGVYWQYPANNWGTMMGFTVPSGATSVAFWAKGQAGGEKVTFLVGGLSAPGNPYQDTISAKRTVSLTSAWTQYEIDLSGKSYSTVIGGFGWQMSAMDVASPPAKFFVDGIEWQ
jgi:hypothetical protein